MMLVGAAHMAYARRSPRSTAVTGQAAVHAKTASERWPDTQALLCMQTHGQIQENIQLQNSPLVLAGVPHAPFATARVAAEHFAADCQQLHPFAASQACKHTVIE